MSNLKKIAHFNDLDSFFDDMGKHSLLDRLGWDLAVDIFEEDGKVIAEMAVPGIDPKKIEISIEDRVLRLAGSREEKTEKKGKHYYKKEIRGGSFKRHITLHADVDATKAKAEYQDGILKVIMPKKNNKESNRVKIDVR